MTTVLCVLDGWGVEEPRADNAITLSKTPNWDRFVKEGAYTELEASGEAVGLPKGQMGNSEVGHMHIGAGRRILQDLPRIDEAVKNDALVINPEMIRFMDQLMTSGGACHLMGLFSDGGVHAHQSHLHALIDVLDEAGIPVKLHLFLDGRDVPPKSALTYLTHLTETFPGIEIATVAGRFYAMDRDQRDERTTAAYDAIVAAKASRFESAQAGIQASYNQNTTDEFVAPFCVADYEGLQPDDGVLHFNFRADRVRQLLTKLVEQHQGPLLGMAPYSSELSKSVPALFPAQVITETLGEVVAAAGQRQLRLAETEKYAHVTYFLNGGNEQVFAGEDRKLIPSPKVATYDQAPEMSAIELTDTLVAALESEAYDLIVVNYANPDMVGHTGNLKASIQAVECVDACLGRVAAALGEGTLLVTADHGNAEQMLNPETKAPHTAHTSNLVPLVILGQGQSELATGSLTDVAPTVLSIMGLEVPKAMTGKSLLPRA